MTDTKKTSKKKSSISSVKQDQARYDETKKEIENTDDEENLDLYGYASSKPSIDVNKRPQTISLALIMQRNLNKSVSYEESKLKLLNRLHIGPISSTRPPRTPPFQLPSLLRSRQLLTDETNSNATNDKPIQVKESVDDPMDAQAKSLMRLTHIRLDREAIVKIENLAEYVGNVTHLYLQHNRIEKIENLEFLVTLKFLVLSHNRLRRVENLRSLLNLKLLDISHNSIDIIDDFAEFPTSLVFLDMRENECLVGPKQTWFVHDYETKLRDRLARLRQLNGRDLLESDRDRQLFMIDETRAASSNSSEDSDEQADKLNDKSSEAIMNTIARTHNMNRLKEQKKLEQEEDEEEEENYSVLHINHRDDELNEELIGASESMANMSTAAATMLPLTKLDDHHYACSVSTGPKHNVEEACDEIIQRSRQRQKLFLVESERLSRERKNQLTSVCQSLLEKLNSSRQSS